MTFDDVLAQVQALLQSERRVSYRGLKRRFGLDDEYVEDPKEELIGAKRLAVDEDERFLVWVGAAPVSSSTFQISGFQAPALHPQPPFSTRRHISPSASVPQLSPMASARPSRPYLLT